MLGVNRSARDVAHFERVAAISQDRGSHVDHSSVVGGQPVLVSRTTTKVPVVEPNWVPQGNDLAKPETALNWSTYHSQFGLDYTLDLPENSRMKGMIFKTDVYTGRTGKLGHDGVT